MKILVALSRFPYPIDKGDKLRAYHQLSFLAQHHDVYAFCLSDEEVSPEAIAHVKGMLSGLKVHSLDKGSIAWRLAKNSSARLPFQVAYFTDTAAKEQLAHWSQKIKPDVFYCQLARMAEYAEVIDAPYKVLDYQDAFSKGLEHRKSTDPWYKKSLVGIEYERLLQYETAIYDRFDACLIISAQDAGYLPIHNKHKLHIVPNGIDTRHFSPMPNVNKDIDLLFTGNLNYPPSVHCVEFIIKEVFPLMEGENIRLVAAGKDPARSLKYLPSHRLQLTGWVDDLRTYFNRARLYCAPMQIGIGLQNKLLEAMAMGLPVITSNLSNNALGATHGENAWLADSAQEVAYAIKHLLHDTLLAKNLGEAGRIFVHHQYGWDRHNKRLAQILAQTSSAEVCFMPENSSVHA